MALSVGGIGKKGFVAFVASSYVAAALALALVGVGCRPSQDLPPVPQPDFDAFVEASGDDGGDGGAPDATQEVSTGDDASPDGSPTATLNQTTLTFPQAPCGMAGTPENLMITNGGSSALAVSASVVGSVFSVSPTLLTLPPGQTGTLSVTPNVPGTATASSVVNGALNLFTNVPGQSNITVPLTATASGAALQYQSAASQGFAFPASVVGFPAPALMVTLVNGGTAPATFAFGTPSNPHFALDAPNTGADGGVTLAAGATIQLAGHFTPTDTSSVTAAAPVTVTGPSCASLQSLAFSGLGATGNVTGWPSTVSFGPVDCGGSAPADQSFVLTNTGAVAAHITQISISPLDSGFSTGTQVGRAIPPQGGTTKIAVSGPPLPVNAPLTPVTATLTVMTDADALVHSITLTEQPNGAVLAFDTTPSTNFGSFGQVALLGQATQQFNVTNVGTGSAMVTLTPSPTPAFSVSSPTFTIGGKSSQAETLTFTPVTGGGTSGHVTMTATGPLCGPLPAGLSVTGSAVGGAPTIQPSTLTFGAVCGGTAPAQQTFIVRNDGNANMTWSMDAPAGPGASGYQVSSNPAPGLLMPAESATVTVSASAIPSPATNASPSAYDAHITINTDVPLDPPHVVTLGETPLGDQLVLVSTAPPLRYGQVPIGSTISQNVRVQNNANPGSPAAAVSFAITGAGAGAYSAGPASLSNLAPGATSDPVAVAFAPSASDPYRASLGVTTTDSLCTPLPAAVDLNGTGTQGRVLVSATSLTFGSDPSDTHGYVNCGTAGLAHSVTVSNYGNQAFNITALSLGRASSSPYTLSGPGTMLPVAIPIGGSTTITVTPSAIPANVQNPNDAAPFSDNLAITTDAAMDAVHNVVLIMQARGAVIANTPLTTTWSFGQISFGSIGTFTSSIQNTGNAPVTVGLSGLSQGSVFGLGNNPTTVTPGGVTSVVGQFTPPSSNGQWSDQGTLTVTPTQVLCEPLPSQWISPTISMSGASNANPPITIAGSLTFPNTSCGDASPAALALTLTNNTNGTYAYTARFNSGAYYCLNGCASDAGVGAQTGTLAANGSVQVLVTPKQVTPGAGVVPGPAPYADDLLISVTTSPANQVAAQYTVPIAWSLNGAVLSLPQGGGPASDTMGNVWYLADTNTGYPLPMLNSGNATASVSFAVQPSGSFAFSPSGTIEVIPGIGASPQLVGSSSGPTCPSTTSATAAFVYSGPVCQPFPLSSVHVHACSGTLTP